MRALTADNARVLESQGLKATPGNLYMLHFLGAGGGPAFLKAAEVDPTLSGASLFPKEAKYNPTIFFDQSGRPRNLGQIYGLVTRTSAARRRGPPRRSRRKPRWRRRPRRR